MKSSFSRHFPAAVWSGLLAFVLTVSAGGIWTALLLSNLATSPVVPWAAIVMALLLWLMWQYLGGRWGPQSTSAARRRYRRARPLSVRVFAWALLAGALSLIALVGAWMLLFQLVKLPARVIPNFTSYPFLTVALVLVTASLVSSLVEEVGFRGYFQGILESQVGAPIAIVIASLLIAPAHGLTQGFFWPILLWYFGADVMFGVLAFFTQSIVPGIVVHSLGLLVFFTLVWPYDVQRRLVWETSNQTGFWLTVAQVIIFAVLALLAFSQLARSSKGIHAVESSTLSPSTEESTG